jgi:hypothetical protein
MSRLVSLSFARALKCCLIFSPPPPQLLAWLGLLVALLWQVYYNLDLELFAVTVLNAIWVMCIPVGIFLGVMCWQSQQWLNAYSTWMLEPHPQCAILKRQEKRREFIKWKVSLIVSLITPIFGFAVFASLIGMGIFLSMINYGLTIAFNVGIVIAAASPCLLALLPLWFPDCPYRITSPSLGSPWRRLVAWHPDSQQSLTKKGLLSLRQRVNTPQDKPLDYACLLLDISRVSDLEELLDNNVLSTIDIPPLHPSSARLVLEVIMGVQEPLSRKDDPPSVAWLTRDPAPIRLLRLIAFLSRTEAVREQILTLLVELLEAAFAAGHYDESFNMDTISDETTRLLWESLQSLSDNADMPHEVHVGSEFLLILKLIIKLMIFCSL